MDRTLSQQEEELNIKLFQQLKAYDFDKIQADADKAVDEELKNPASNEKLDEAGKKLDNLQKSISGEMGDTIKGMTVLVAEKVRNEHPELAGEAEAVLKQLEGYEIPPEKLQEIEQLVEDAKGNLGEVYADRMRSMVSEALDDLPGEITEQFNEKVQEKAVEAQANYDQSVIGFAKMLTDMHNQPHGGPNAVKAMLPSFKAMGEQGEKAIELFKKNLFDEDRQAYETPEAATVGAPVTP